MFTSGTWLFLSIYIFPISLVMDIETLWRFQVEPLTLISNSRVMEVYHMMDIT